MTACTLNRVHALGSAARTPFYPTHRVRARHTHSVRWVARGSKRQTACTARRLNVQKIARWDWRAGTSRGWPRDRANYPAHFVQRPVK
jgi:hypothetical protein